MADLPYAYISHITSGRLRLRIPSKKADQAYFFSLREHLSSLPGVQAVVVNPVTGSILIRHTYDPKDMDLKPVAEYTEASGLFKLQIPEQTERVSIAEQVAGSMEGLNAQLKEWTNDAIDFQSLAFLGLVGVSLFQAGKGLVMIPAITALWYASSILKDIKSKERGGQDETGKDNGKKS
jgi:hypothetical protein